MTVDYVTSALIFNLVADKPRDNIQPVTDGEFLLDNVQVTVIKQEEGA
jgi:hypothetical protein